MGKDHVAARAAALVSIACLTGWSCRPHFTVQNAPLPPEQAGSFRTERPEIPQTVQIADFKINRVDTQYHDSEKDLFRKHLSVAIPNALQEFMGRQQVLAAVTRSAAVIPTTGDYVVTGEYDFYERLGTRGREWIPFYGTFGGKINVAHVRGELTVHLHDARTGERLFSRMYPEEHRDVTSIYKRPQVGYLQAPYLSTVSNELIVAVRSHAGGSKPAVRTGPESQEPASAAERIEELETLRKRGLITDVEFREQRQRIIEGIGR
jgi:hypothetical protein